MLAAGDRGIEQSRSRAAAARPASSPIQSGETVLDSIEAGAALRAGSAPSGPSHTVRAAASSATMLIDDVGAGCGVARRGRHARAPRGERVRAIAACDSRR